MLDLLQTIIVTVLTLAILVAVHEFGHFWVARRCGVKVLRFSVGFGKPLLSWSDKSGTEYVVAGIPLGGYVKMLDEREGEVPEELLDQAFNRASPPKRIAIAAAGPFANFALAIVVYWCIFLNGVNGVAPVIGSVELGSLADRAGLQAGAEITAVDGVETPTWESLQMQLLERIGESGDLTMSVKPADSSLVTTKTLRLDGWMQEVADPNPLRELGIQLYVPKVLPKIQNVMPDSAAQKAGLQAGDLVLSVDGVEMPDWDSWVNIVRASPEQPLSVVVDRDGRQLPLTLTPARTLDDSGVAIGFVGVGVEPPSWPEEMERKVAYGPIAALVAAADKTWKMSAFTLESIKKMITGMLSPKNLSGPITIAKVASSSAQYGFFAWMSFLGLLSISLAVLNLLPIPILDGGHIIYASIEWVIGKPVTEQIQLWANQLGLALVVCVMVFALYNDVLRL